MAAFFVGILPNGMNILAGLVASPLLYKVDGVEYEVSPFTHADLAELSQYAQFMPYYRVRDMDVLDEWKHKVFMECYKTTVKDGLARLDEEPGGMVMMAYVSLRRRHPNITKEQIASWHTDDIVRIGQIANILTGAHATLLDDAKKKKLATVINDLVTGVPLDSLARQKETPSSETSN